MTFPDGPELALPAGDVTVGVVRIGDTVRRPHQATSGFVADYLTHLERVGFVGAPRYLGRDAQGRDVLTFLEGDVASGPEDAWARADDVLPGVARLVRRLHDASGSFPVPEFRAEPGRPDPEEAADDLVVAQRDVTLQNTVFRDGAAWGLIDFDLSNRTTRATDLVNTAMHWVPLCAPADRGSGYDGDATGARFRAMYDAYGRDRFDVEQLLDAARLRFEGSYAIMKWAAEHRGGGWAQMWHDGVGDLILRRVAWFADVRDDLRTALTSPSAR